MDTIKKWSGTKNKGATVIIADDAEYTGTTGYFFVKYFRDYDRSFAVDPTAYEKLTKLVTAVEELGEFASFKEACEREAVEEPFYVEDRFAWHKTYADAWAGTPEAKAWDPVLAEIRREYKEKYQPIVEKDDKYRDIVEKFWFHVTNSANSDGRWPPPPALTCEFNRNWVLDEIDAAKAALKELAEVTKGIKVEPVVEVEEPSADGCTYDFHYTDKDTSNLKKLNFYELSHHLYKCYDMFDNGSTSEIKEKGRQLVNAIYEEFENRNLTGMIKKRL
jgi:hypothetical protein